MKKQTRWYYIQLNPKFPGKINGTQRTNVGNLEGWDYELDPDDPVSKMVCRDGGKFWWFDESVERCYPRLEVKILAEFDRVAVGEYNTIRVEGVPDALSSVALLINGEEPVLLERLPDGSLDTLLLGWDQPTPVTVRLSPVNVSLRAKPLLISFEEPADAV
jgi:hypothetical protein